MQNSQLKNIFSNLPEKPLDSEVFETLLQNNNVRLERIISTGARGRRFKSCCPDKK